MTIPDFFSLVQNNNNEENPADFFSVMEKQQSDNANAKPIVEEKKPEQLDNEKIPDFVEVVNNKEEYTNDVDKLLNMPREDFLKLPFKERAAASKEIAGEAKRQVDTAITRGLIPGLKSFEEGFKIGKIPLEIDQYLDMPAEEFAKLPFKEKAAISKLMGETGLALPLRNLLSKVEVERPDLPKTKLLNPITETALEMTGELPWFFLMEKTVSEIPKAKTKFVNPIMKVLGFGGTGATYTAGRKLLDEGELPTASEFAKDGLLWSGIEAATSLLGYTGRLGLAINRMAKAKNIPRKEALKIMTKAAEDAGINLEHFAEFASKESKSVKLIEQRKKEVESFIKIAEKEAGVQKSTDVGKKTLAEVKNPDVKSLSGEAKVTSRSKKLNNQLDEVLVNANGTILEKSKPIELDLFRGTGGGGKVSFPENVLGKAEYFALSKETASDYGKKVIKKKVKLNNPLILNSDEDLKKVWNKKTSPKSGDFQELRQNILDAGYDGVVVHAKERLAFDSNDNGERIKALNDIFGDSQVIVFPENDVKSKSKKVQKSKPKETAKPEQSEDITTQKVSKEHFQTKSTAKETIEHVSREPHELYHPPVYGEAAEKLSVIDKLRNKLTKALRKKSPLSKKSWEIRQDYYGKRWGLDMRYKEKWNKVIKEAKLSSSELEDMIFYIEDPKAIGKSRSDKGTGNPFKGRDDTWDSVSKRLSPKAKEAVKIVQEHFKEMLKVLNESPWVKDINPREFLEQIYVPHFYEGKTKDVLDTILKQKNFSTKNPLANMRKFNTFNDALKEAGLIPKYRNINDLLNHYDNLMIRVLSNSELAGQIKELETELGQKLIARPNNKKLYKQARAEGWVEFSDPYLRRRVIGKQNGKPIFATSEANALVHPDIADSLVGIFTKDAYRPESMILGGIDAYNDAVRQWRVSISPVFHMGALGESLVGAQGFGGFKKLIKDWDIILSDSAFNEFAAESGLKFGIPSDTAIKDSRVMFDKTLNKMELEAGKKGLAAKGVRKGLQKLQVGSNFLFNEIHPRMKMTTFNDYMVQAERRAIKKGIALTPEWRKQAGREVASIVNDQFGGQMWELMKVFGNPNNVKLGRRFVSYLDWSLSSIRQFGAMFNDVPKILSGNGTSLKGSLARKYNARYVSAITMISQLRSYLNTGLTNRKDSNGKNIPNSIYWDYNKAHSTFENKDPKHSGYLSQFFHFQLPDIELSVMGNKFNPGRDKDGRLRYSHHGKQLLELANYATNTVGALYSKSSAAIQFVLPFVTGSIPGEGNWKPRGTWKGGNTVPWDGSEPFTLARLGSRAKFVGENLVPFVANSLYNDPGAFVSTWFGMTPISKGISLTASGKYYNTYYRVLYGDGYNTKSKKEASEKINELDNVLLDNKYKMKQIKRYKTIAKNEVKKDLAR